MHELVPSATGLLPGLLFTSRGIDISKIKILALKYLLNILLYHKKRVNKSMANGYNMYPNYFKLFKNIYVYSF